MLQLLPTSWTVDFPALRGEYTDTCSDPDPDAARPAPTSPPLVYHLVRGSQTTAQQVESLSGMSVESRGQRRSGRTCGGQLVLPTLGTRLLLPIVIEVRVGVLGCPLYRNIHDSFGDHRMNDSRSQHSATAAHLLRKPRCNVHRCRPSTVHARSLPPAPRRAITLECSLY